jgi:distribution and morphology protein 10
LTLTLTPLTGSLASTYSVRPTENLALSSRFGFNVYSWESEYVLGAEIWRRRRKSPLKPSVDPDPTAWARDKAAKWLTEAQRALERERVDREEENVIKLRIDDGWNIRALWTGRVKQLLVSAGVSMAPASSTSYRYQVSGLGGGSLTGGGVEKRWKGSVGIEVAYSS